jgi:transposase
MVNRDGRSCKRSKKKCACKHKKIKPIRRDGYTTKQALQTINLSYIDEITRKSKGRKGFKNSNLIKAMLLMYIRGMDSLLELERFLRTHQEWLYFLNLKRNVKGKIEYVVPDRTTYDKLIKRLGTEGMTEIFTLFVIQMIEKGIIKGNILSVDATIIEAWFKDKDKGKNGKLRKSKDRDASTGYDSYREMYIYGYKIHVVIDVKSGLPICISVTKAGYGESRTLRPFVEHIHQRFLIDVEKFLADSGYDGNLNRLDIIKMLEAIPYIALNPRNCKGDTMEEKAARRKKLCEKFYKRERVHEYWVDPDSDSFGKTMKARTFSEQTFSLMRGSLNLDRYRHRGIVWATAHALLTGMSMLVVANAAVTVDRPDLMRCIKCFRL